MQTHAPTPSDTPQAHAHVWTPAHRQTHVCTPTSRHKVVAERLPSCPFSVFLLACQVCGNLSLPHVDLEPWLQTSGAAPGSPE